jgi:hypothetical protein
VDTDRAIVITMWCDVLIVVILIVMMWKEFQ